MAHKQRMLHIITECLAIPAAIFLFYIAYTAQLPQWQTTILYGIGIANLIIDGYFITTWIKTR